MVNIAASIAARFPATRPLIDWGVRNRGAEDEIFLWDEDAMGHPLPTLDDLAEWALLVTPPTTPRWVEFGASLAADPGVNALVATAAQAAPVLHLMLGVGLGQAAQGDPQTFITAWSTAIGAGLIPPELAASIQTMAAEYDLPAEFVAVLSQ